MGDALHDVIIIGAGREGCAAALEAARLGLDVLLVDPRPLHGDAYLRNGTLATEVLRETLLQLIEPRRLEDLDAARPRPGNVPVDTLVHRARSVIAGHVDMLRRRLETSGVCVKTGSACFESARKVRIDGHGVYEAATIVIACASRARRPARFPFDDRVVCDGDSVLHVESTPRCVVVVGADVIGCEFACMFAALGASVTLIDRRRQLLRFVDRDILKVLHARMHGLGIDVVLEEQIDEVEIRRGGGEPHAILKLASGRVESCDRLLIVAGRQSDVESLRLEPARVQTGSHGCIHVDEFFQTSQPGIYAVGDVVGAPVAATSEHQGRVAILHASGAEPPMGHDLPMAIYTIPELAMVGLTEEACERLDVPYGTGIARYSDILRGRIRGDLEGMLKLVFQREDGRLLGVHLIGEGSSELVHLGASLIESGATTDRVANTLFHHPSLSEAYRVAALDGLAASGSPGESALPRPHPGFSRTSPNARRAS